MRIKVHILNHLVKSLMMQEQSHQFQLVHACQVLMTKYLLTLNRFRIGMVPFENLCTNNVSKMRLI